MCHKDIYFLSWYIYMNLISVKHMPVLAEADRERIGNQRIKTQGLPHGGGVAMVAGIAQIT
jgi:hypothetical protein